MPLYDPNSVDEEGSDPRLFLLQFVLTAGIPLSFAFIPETGVWYYVGLSLLVGLIVFYFTCILPFTGRKLKEGEWIQSSIPHYILVFSLAVAYSIYLLIT